MITGGTHTGEVYVYTDKAKYFFTLSGKTFTHGDLKPFGLNLDSARRMDRLVDLSKCTITTNAPMLYKTTTYTPDSESGGLATREAVFDRRSNMWDGDPNTCFHTNFDLYNSDWSMRDIKKNNYIQVELPSAVKQFDVYIKNPHKGGCLSSGTNCFGVDFDLSENGSIFNTLQFSVPNGRLGDENKWENLSNNGNSIKYIRIKPTNGGAFPYGTFEGANYGCAPFGIAELKIWDADPAWVAPVPVESVTLDKTNIEMSVGGQQTLTATVLPADATDKSVTWSTSAPGVATVNNGVVTAVGVGSATITVTTNDGGKTATCQVTVTELPHITWVFGGNPIDFNFTSGDTPVYTKCYTTSKSGSAGDYVEFQGERGTFYSSDVDEIPETISRGNIVQIKSSSSWGNNELVNGTGYSFYSWIGSGTSGFKDEDDYPQVYYHIAPGYEYHLVAGGKTSGIVVKNFEVGKYYVLMLYNHSGRDARLKFLPVTSTKP